MQVISSREMIYKALLEKADSLWHLALTSDAEENKRLRAESEAYKELAKLYAPKVGT